MKDYIIQFLLHKTQKDTAADKSIYPNLYTVTLNGAKSNSIE